MINVSSRPAPLAPPLGGKAVEDRSKPGVPGDPERLVEAAQQFEAWFIQSMLKEVREAGGEGGGMFDTDELRTYSELFDQEIAGRISQGRGLGLASSIARSLAAREYGGVGTLPPSASGTAQSRHGLPPPSVSALGSRPTGAMAWPLPSDSPGRVTSTFGLREDPIHGGERQHHGLDLAAPSGTPILSVGDGVVLRSGWVPGYGRMVEVDHGGGVVARYAHGSRLDVEVGAQVQKGSVLGAVGSSGRSTGSHLHLEVRVDGQPVDPAAWLHGEGSGDDAIAAGGDDGR